MAGRRFDSGRRGGCPPDGIKDQIQQSKCKVRLEFCRNAMRFRPTIPVSKMYIPSVELQQLAAKWVRFLKKRGPKLVSLSLLG